MALRSRHVSTPRNGRTTSSGPLWSRQAALAGRMPSPTQAAHKHGVYGFTSAAPSSSQVQTRAAPLPLTVPTSTPAAWQLPPVISWFVEPKCNYGCKFCYATFEDIPKDQVVQDRDLLMKVPGMLKAAGVNRITFVGGEPFLHPHIEDLITETKACGMLAAVITNGSRLDEARLRRLQGKLDWIGFSVDSSRDEMHAAMGRGVKSKETWPSLLPPAQTAQTADTSSSSSHSSSSSMTGSAAPGSVNNHIQRVRKLWPVARALGFRLKLNTVVTRVNLQDDMSALVLELKPDRWKAFQVLPVEGQNSGRVEPLLISREEFLSWAARHQAAVQPHGIQLVAEDNEDMTGTYGMLDARGRFYTNNAADPHDRSCTSGHVYGPSLFEVGVLEAWQAVAPFFRADGFVDRGGLYQWGQSQGDFHQQQLWLNTAAGPAARNSTEAI